MVTDGSKAIIASMNSISLFQFRLILQIVTSQERFDLSAALLLWRLNVVELLTGLAAQLRLQNRRLFRLQLEAVCWRLLLLGRFYSVAMELRLLHLQLLGEELLRVNELKLVLLLLVDLLWDLSLSLCLRHWLWTVNRLLMLRGLILLLLMLRSLILLHVRLNSLIQWELAVGLCDWLIQSRVVLSTWWIVHQLSLVNRIRSMTLRSLRDFNRLRRLRGRRLGDRLEAAVIVLELFEFRIEIDCTTLRSTRECDTLLLLCDISGSCDVRWLGCHIRDGLWTVSGCGWLGLLKGQYIVLNSVQRFWCNVYWRCWCWLGVTDWWWCLCGLNYLNAWALGWLNESWSRGGFRDLCVLNCAVIFFLWCQRLMVVTVLENGGWSTSCWCWSRSGTLGGDRTFRVILWNVLIGIFNRLVALIFLVVSFRVVRIAWISADVIELTLVACRDNYSIRKCSKYV